MTTELVSKIIQATTIVRPPSWEGDEQELVTTVVCDDGSVWMKERESNVWELVARPFRGVQQRARDEAAKKDRDALKRIDRALKDAGYHVPPSVTDLATTIEVMLSNQPYRSVMACPECRGAGKTTNGYIDRACSACDGRGTL